MSSDRVTIQDIAFELGVSTATVSNVINGKTKKISDETISLVERKLEEMGYLPRQARIMMGKNPSRLVGLIINDHEKYEGHPLEDGYMSKLVNSLAIESERRGLLLIVKLATRIDDVPLLASLWNMSAVMVQGFCEVDYQYLKNQMHRPLIIFDGFFPANDSYVNLEVDNYQGGVVAGEYLRKMGHSRVLCLSDNNICLDALRFQGLCSIIPQSNLMIIPKLKKERESFYKSNLDEILKYSAVFAVSDYYALDLIRNLQASGVKIPQDISVLGFDDTAISADTFPPLTTIRQDCEKRASIAFDLIYELERDINLRKVVSLPVEVVERETVKKI
ncbi:LacI family transcriptional regulator [Spirochaetales bacterium NM-380-WT-3C1]|uniref:LacI family transcriptional regulator n=1 Tax=Bullifex porci TaxID=2606638 RepID=A0A7X2PCM2_9SPIO|nr:LacI family DNA-binding transcriptional regulator [Bullifex porci]MSU06402.1 LacI family transcriptional regulator [Bullifex porci]